MRQGRVKNKTLGQVRYMTYYLIFPKDKDYWVESRPFVHDLDFEISKMKLRDDMKIQLKTKGETKFVDHNGVTHRIVIDNEPKPRKWGIK